LFDIVDSERDISSNSCQAVEYNKNIERKNEEISNTSCLQKTTNKWVHDSREKGTQKASISSCPE